MNINKLIALSLTGLLLPDMASAAPAISVSLTESLTPTLAATSSRRSKKKRKARRKKKKQPTVTPDLPKNFTAAGEADLFPEEDAAYSALRKLCYYLNAGDYETAAGLFSETVKNYRFVRVNMAKNATEEVQEDETDIAPDDIVASLEEIGYLTSQYEVFQVLERENDELKALICQLSHEGTNRYSTLALAIDKSTGRIINLNLSIYSEEANEAPASALMANADVMIQNGMKQANIAPTIKSAATAESNGWWAPDMEFTKDPKVKASILGPSISPMYIIQATMLKDNYLSFLRSTDMRDAHRMVLEKFAPRVWLIGQNREVSRDELYSILSDKELLLSKGAYITTSGYKGHCYQFVICCPNQQTRQKEYIRVCMLLDRNLKITGIMESKCVNAPATVNPSFKNTGTSVEVVDHSNDPSGEDWLKRFLDTWTAADENAWNELLADELSYLYLPGMTSGAKNVNKQEVIELMKEGVPQLLAGGYEIVQLNNKSNSVCEAIVTFNTPAPNGKKVKATIMVNFIKAIHAFEVVMSYVDDNKKFTQGDFLAAIDGSNPDDIPTEERPLSEVAPDLRGAEVLRRILEGVKADDDQAIAEVVGPRNHINTLTFPKDGLESRISSDAAADIKAGIKEAIPHLDKVGYKIYVSRTQHDGVSTTGILAINDGKSRGAIDYEFSILYQHGHVTSFSLTSQSSIVIGGAKKSAKVVADIPAPEGATIEVAGLCPTDMDFSADPRVKEAEAKAPVRNEPLILENACSSVVDLYKIKRMMGTGRHSAMGQLQDIDIMAPQISVIGEEQPYSSDSLFARLDTPELLWGSNCSIYKMGYKGCSLHVIFRFGDENEDPLFISTVLLVDQFGTLNYLDSKIYAVGESVLQNREPELMPGYQKARTAEEQRADMMAQFNQPAATPQPTAVPQPAVTPQTDTTEPETDTVAAPAPAADSQPAAPQQPAEQSNGLLWGIIAGVGAFLLGVIALLLVLLLRKKAPEAPKPTEPTKAPEPKSEEKPQVTPAAPAVPAAPEAPAAPAVSAVPETTLIPDVPAAPPAPEVPEK